MKVQFPKFFGSPTLFAAIAGGVGLTSGPRASAALLVDNFISQQQVVVSTDASGSVQIGTASASAPSAIGGQRDVLVQKIFGAEQDELRARVNPNGAALFRISADEDVRGSTFTIYDGASDFSQTGVIDYDGLGGIDVTGETAFRVTVGASDLAGPLSVTIWDADDLTGNTFAVLSQTVAPRAAISGPIAFDFLLDDFTVFGASSLNDVYDSVGAIQFGVNGNGAAQAGWDSRYQSLEFIPEPGHFSLVGALLAFGVSATRRRN